MEILGIVIGLLLAVGVLVIARVMYKCKQGGNPWDEDE